METEWISILDVIKKGNFEASLITTFNAYLPFYEEVVLRHLVSAGCRHNVLIMDEGQFSDCLKTPTLRPFSAGYNYTLIPISSNGAFHPKIILLVARKKGLLFVGSHNITFSGLGINKELTTCIDISDGSHKQGIQIAQDACKFIEKWMNRQSSKLPKQLFDAFNAIKRFAPWLIKHKEPGEADLLFFGSDPDEKSIWENISENIVGPIKRITVIGPYFDSHLEFLDKLKTDFNLKEIFVGIEPDSVSIPDVGIRKSDFQFIDASSLPKTAGFLHAKAIYIEAVSSEAWLILGSANPTKAAWFAKANSRNAEAVLLINGETAKKTAENLRISEIINLPLINEETWLAINKRALLEKKKNSAEGPRQKFLIGIANSNTIQISKSKFPYQKFIEAKCVDQNQNSIDNIKKYEISDEYIHIPISKDLLKVRFVEIILEDSEPIICLVHHEQEINRRSVSSRQVQFRRTLASLQSDNPDLENLIKTVEKIIFDEPFEIDPTVPKKIKTKSQSPDSENKKEIDTLAIDLDETKKEKRRKRMLVSGDIGHLIDILIHQLGLGLDRNTEGIDKKGRTEEELIGSDDEESEKEPELIDMPKMVKICNGKVKRLVTRMIKNFEKTNEDKKEYERCLMKLLAVLALLRELRALDYKLDGIPYEESLFPVKERERLLQYSLKYLYGRDHKFFKNIENEFIEEPWDEIARLHGLLLWLAHDCGADFGEEKKFNESLEDKKKRTLKKSYMLLIAPNSVTDPIALQEAEIGIDKTTPKFRKSNNKIWINTQKTLGEKFFRLIKRAHLIHHKVKGSPRIGYLAFLRDEVDPTLHIVLQTGNHVILTDICAKDGKRYFPISRVAGIPFPKA